LSDPPQVRQSVRDRNKLDDACPSLTGLTNRVAVCSKVSTRCRN